MLHLADLEWTGGEIGRQAGAAFQAVVLQLPRLLDLRLTYAGDSLGKCLLDFAAQDLLRCSLRRFVLIHPGILKSVRSHWYGHLQHAI